VRWSIKGSFDGDFSGLGAPERSILTFLAGSGETLKPDLLRLGGVTHAVRFPGLSPVELPLVASIPTFHSRPALLLRVPEPRPMAYVVHRIRDQPSPEAAIRALTDPAFDSAREVIRVRETGRPARLDPAPPETPAEARLEAEEEDRWVVRTRSSAPGTLVVLMAASEGWQARVDGRPEPIVPANVLFQSVDLAAGEHTVEFEYQTPGLRLGFGLSVTAWAWLALASARKSRGIGDGPGKKT
jgi:hypothetical protein